MLESNWDLWNQLWLVDNPRQQLGPDWFSIWATQGSNPRPYPETDPVNTFPSVAPKPGSV